MKRRLLLIVPVVVALMALGAVLAMRPAAPAHADTRNGWLPVYPPDNLPPPYLDGLCAFRIDLALTTNQEYSKVIRTLSDGTTITETTGALGVNITNDVTKKTINYNVSGPGTLTTYPDKSTVLVGQGLGVQFFPPPANTQFGIPAVAYIQGRYTESMDANGNITGFTLNGTISDVCAALS
jgi:hypothetical protein